MDIIDFIKSPWGTVCIGVLSSVLGAFLFSLGVKLVVLIDTKKKKKRFIKWLVKTGESFGDGYTTAYARYKSTFHQDLLVGRYQIKLVSSIAITIGISIAGLFLLVVFQEFIIARLLIVAATCAIITMNIKRVNAIIKSYNMMFDYVFGDEYKTKMMEGIKHHWDSIVQGKEETKGEKDSKDN